MSEAITRHGPHYLQAAGEIYLPPDVLCGGTAALCVDDVTCKNIIHIVNRLQQTLNIVYIKINSLVVMSSFHLHVHRHKIARLGHHVFDICYADVQLGAHPANE